MTGLRALDRVESVYEVPRDDVAKELLIPAMAASQTVRIMTGFFSASSFIALAPGLAAFINSDNEPLRLLLSPKISTADGEAIARAIDDPEQVVARAMRLLFDGELASQSAIINHVLDCLAYLIAKDRLILKFVVMKQGMFHPKVWLFEAGGDVVAVHGSANVTEPGLLFSCETVSVDRPWRGGEDAGSRVAHFVNMFDRYWNDLAEGALTIDAPAGLLLVRDRVFDEPPTIADYWKAWNEDMKRGLAPPLPQGVRSPPFAGDNARQAAKLLTIPDWLDWEHPPYSHQATAIARLAEHNYTGLVAMATGGGKTKTSLICCVRIQDENPGPVLVSILVPTTVLAEQWKDEVAQFGVAPTMLSGGIKPEVRAKHLDYVSISLRPEIQRTEVLIATLSLFNTDESLRRFLSVTSERGVRTVLIADEAHNFGAKKFISDPPKYFDHRLGLSATPIRQYDVEGTSELFAFFQTEGQPAFTFSIGDAIKSGCLTPYNYFLHRVELTDTEMDVYIELTRKLWKAGVRDDNGRDSGLSDYKLRLLMARRALVEQSTAKISMLRDLLITRAQTLTRALFYCSAKAIPKEIRTKNDVRQIDLVREVLQDLRISTHMFTAEETRKPAHGVFLEQFLKGELQSLLAMKVLDEGVDLPMALEAFLLASSTVEREWIQRRGRLLRNAPSKTHADLHDFVVCPPDPEERDARKLVQSELRRANHFANDSKNLYEPGGPRDIIREIEKEYGVYPDEEDGDE